MSRKTSTAQEGLGFVVPDRPGDDDGTAGVEALGLHFESEEERRAHFRRLLAEKLKDPVFRALPGFPVADDEAILRMSDPPWYTACPNPFLGDFARTYGKNDGPATRYHREPLAADTRVGKTDQLFQLHSYHTKVPYLAIVPSILHYTEPGDLVLDGFCGSGMTGVAAQWCGAAPPTYRKELEQDWAGQGLARPAWGARRAILNDLGPAATFITAGFNLPFEVKAFEKAARALFEAVDRELGWMYETAHSDGRKGSINYTVWSEVFACPDCAGEIVFTQEAMDDETKRVSDDFPCPHCDVRVSKSTLVRRMETSMDPATGRPWSRVTLRPVLINYRVGKTVFEKAPDPADLAVLKRVQALPQPAEVPTTPFPIEQMYHGSRLAPKGFTRVHHLFLPRAACALAAMWRAAQAEPDPDTRRILVFLAEQGVWTMALLNRYQPGGYKQVNKFLNGVYYVPSQHCEVSPRYALAARSDRMARAFRKFSRRRAGNVIVSTATAARLDLPDNCVDYVFTDPPFGENIFYADLNFLVEAWHRVLTDAGPEAIIDQPKLKPVGKYGRLMHECFAEYHRVLKPGRWMTMVFSNSHNAVWNAIQEALGESGFVVADVRMLDKKQGSYRQVTSSAVKRDLVVSCYKPSERLERRLGGRAPDEEAGWAFVREHLEKLPVWTERDGAGEVLSERTADVLFDRMVAFFVQRHLAVPLDKGSFLAGIEQRFTDRDGMVFLFEQVAEYDKRRVKVDELGQLPLIVTDESSAIRWLREELRRKPQKFEEIQPDFMSQTRHWARDREKTVDLREMLDQNFLCYEGEGHVPGPIHAYLSSNFKDLRGLEKDDPRLVSKALKRWYVPDPSRAGDLDKRRRRALLREFDEYVSSRGRRLGVFRREAVKAGFEAAYQDRAWDRIITVGDKLPPKVLEEDFELYMFVENARTQLGEVL